MAIQFPYLAQAGVAVDPAEIEAENLYANLVWIARLSEEMTADPALNLKRLMQLVMHTRKLQHWWGALAARGATAAPVVEGVFRKHKMLWATRAEMVADLTGLRDECQQMADWIKATLPDFEGGFATTKVLGYSEVDGSPTLTDEARMSTKPAEFVTRIAALRAKFGPAA